MTAYVTAHLNVDGDVYAEAAAVSEIKKTAVSPQLLKLSCFLFQEDNWLKFENGSQVGFYFTPL